MADVYLIDDATKGVFQKYMAATTNSIFEVAENGSDAVIKTQKGVQTVVIYE